MPLFAWPFIIASLGLFTLAVILTWLHTLGPLGKKAAHACTRTPTLDILLSLFTWAPWWPAWLFTGWLGLAACIAGQITGLAAWIVLHELVNYRAAAGPRIVRFLNTTVGRWRNHAALWVTVGALPLFWFIRAAQIFLYPLLTILVGLPAYKQSEWVNVSRQKFSGLVGHDLIWCLYCDWMTGVYSLGAEMLRNVESFWCPIRFYDDKKCENCKADFPDVARGWVPATATMADVVDTMTTYYSPKSPYAADPNAKHAWFNHPARKAIETHTQLTVHGSPPQPPTP